MSRGNPTYILGINDGIVATACLIRDGSVIACASEERFTRQKNQAGLPVCAIQYCLEAGGIAAHDLDLVATSTASMPPFFLEPGHALQRRQFDMMVAVDRWLITHPQPWVRGVERALYDWLAPQAGRRVVRQRARVLAKLLKVPLERIVAFDHHLSHGAAALWASPFVQQHKAVLVLTCDGEGDGLSATVSEFRQGRWVRRAETHLADSLGHFYAAVTQHLGMRPHDHEYKVMGLAPYASPAARDAALTRLEGLFEVRHDLTFHAKVHMRACRRYLEEALHDVRFDAIAAAAQALVEQVLTTWIERAVAQTGIDTVAVGGGVFMNVKANMLVASLPMVRELFVMPSPGDESTALGAAYLGYQRLHPGAAIEPIRDVFWGPDLTAEAIRRAMASTSSAGLHLTKPTSLAEAIADLLAQGHVVARVTGRMEWGARALGHRSLLADPAHPGVVETINRAIKQRDFWMPFAPVILDEAWTRYLDSPEPTKVNAEYMMVAFRSTRQAQHELAAGLHPYDKTLRAQRLTPHRDPQYYEIIQRFGARTGRYGLVNTSYNIHGEPMVCTAEDAVSTLKRSGLQHLALGPYLITQLETMDGS